MDKFFKVALLLMLASCTPAFAQTFPKPPDVETYETVPETYASGATANVTGNGVDDDGGTMEVTGDEPAALDLADPSPWLEAGGALCRLASDGGACTERKFRTHIHWSHNGNNDPIRNYGQAGASHCHSFFGNAKTNANSTYASLRTRPTSTAGGGRLNGTGYWHPCVIKSVGGKTRIIKPKLMVVYYTIGDRDPRAFKNIPRGFRYVFGFPMDDPTGSIRKGYLTAANAAAPGRYRFEPDTGITDATDVARLHGSLGWTCTTSGGSDVVTVAGGTRTPGLTLAGGGDPWGGACPSDGTATIMTAIDGPRCIDGKNLWSPGGYKHASLGLYDNNVNTVVCPTGWFQIAPIQISFRFDHYGFADFSQWKLSSDDMVSAALGSTVLPGSTFHTDWMDGWDSAGRQAATGWEVNCIGIGVASAPRGAECNDSQINGTNKLITGATSPDTGSPQLDTNNGRDGSDTADTSTMPVLPATANPSGNQTVHVHGN